MGSMKGLRPKMHCGVGRGKETELVEKILGKSKGFAYLLFSFLLILAK
jgi:hypothetical protein